MNTQISKTRYCSGLEIDYRFYDFAALTHGLHVTSLVVVFFSELEGGSLEIK